MKRAFPPSPRRLRKARERGDIAKGPEITAICVAATGFALFGIGSQKMQQILESVHNFESYQECEWGQLFEAVFGVLCAILALLFIVSAAVEMLQVGWILQSPTLKWERLNPVSGFRRLLGVPSEGESLLNSSLWELVKFLAILLSAVSLSVLCVLQTHGEPGGPAFVRLCFAEALGVMGLLPLGLFFLGVSIYQRRVRLRMTLQEVKEELHESEGRAETREQRKQFFHDIALSGAFQKRPTLIIKGGRS